MISFLTLGVILGLSSGLAPGPLLTLLLMETLQHGIKAGVKVALAPIITDLPIIVLTLFVLSKLSGFHSIIGIISLAGGCFIFFMGYQSIRSPGLEIKIQNQQPQSFTKGILTNALNPHPYLFWFSVGAPLMAKAMQGSIYALLAFICSFYALLVGSKILLAILVGKSRAFLAGKKYVYTLRSLGFALCVLALILLYDGLKLLKLI